MKYLVIGDSNSMHIFNFVKSVLLPSGFEVHLLTLSTLPIREEYRAFYRDNGVFVHSIAEKGYKGLTRKDYFYRMLNLLRKFRLMRDVPVVDICHIHSVYKTSLVMALHSRKKFNNLILSYWGGDIENRSQKVIKLRAKCFEFADAITVTTKQILKDFHQLYGSRYNDKLRVCRFATGGLDCIRNLHNTTTRQECRESYGIPLDKVCITCGYSAYAEQHQDRCLMEIQRLPEEIRAKLFVIVPMQYGRFNEEYIELVKQTVLRCDFECVILEKFVSFEESVRLAIATDIYLHLRDTDAFSNALKEHVYASSHIVTGAWLKYPELEEMKAPLVSISSFDELTDTLQHMIERITIDSNISLFTPIYELYSTANIKQQWLEVINFATDR